MPVFGKQRRSKNSLPFLLAPAVNQLAACTLWQLLADRPSPSFLVSLKTLQADMIALFAARRLPCNSYALIPWLSVLLTLLEVRFHRPGGRRKAKRAFDYW